MDITQTILYKGLSLKLHVKRAFMRQIIKSKEVVGELAELLKNERICSNLTLGSIKLGRGKQFQICEEDLDYLFDEMIGRKVTDSKLEKMSEDVRREWLMYKDIFESDGEEVVLDVTNFITYAILMSSKCIKCLYEEIEDKQLHNTLVETFERSKYRAEDFEKCIDARKVGASRLIRGLLVLFREQRSEQLYRIIINVITAGFGRNRRMLKQYETLDSDALREIQRRFIDEENINYIYLACEQVIMYVLSEDLGKEICWDFTLLSLAYNYMSYAEELKGCYFQTEVGELTEEDCKEELEKVKAKYGTYNSVNELICGRGDGEKTSHISGLIHSYQISPRKFNEFSLTVQEVTELMNQKEHWNTKDYMYCMVIAVLCKYIKVLEEIVAETDTDILIRQKAHIESQQESINKIKYEKEAEQKKWTQKWKDKENQYNKVLLEQERQIECMLEKEQVLKDTICTYEQELKELRGYVYGMRQEWMEKLDIDVEEQSKVWQNRKVIVFGGHINWQRKLREKFPKWQFVMADIKSFSNDLIRGKDYIICNTDMLSHASYYKIISERSKNQHLLYVHSNNLNLCIKELCMQLEG